MGGCKECSSYKDGKLSQEKDGWCNKLKVEVSKTEYCRKWRKKKW